MNVLSLFSGIGGLELGLERAGMTVVGQVEIDPFCRQVLAKHWPEVPRHDDVRTCVEWWLGEPRPAVDVVAGGFPCQPVSVAGQRRAQADDRWLWPAFHAVIRDLRPRYAIMENVPGLLGRGMGDVLGDLAEIGYDTEWDCIPAAAVGAPHRRDRVFVVAYPDRDGRTERSDVPPSAGRDDRPVAARRGAALADTDGEAGRPQARDAESRDGAGALAVRAQESRRRGTGLADAHGPRRGPWAGLGWTWPTPVRDGWWTTEPDVGRMVARVPGRVDRLRSLGNAVVPQVAEHIGRLVMAGAA